MANVLITGGSSGIGLASAERFARRGDRVALIARGELGLTAARRRLAAAGGSCEVFAADVTDRAALERQVDAAVAALGGLDVVVVAVAASTYGRFTETPPEDFDRVLAVSFGSAVDTVRAVLPQLERSGGNLVVIGSVAGELPLPLMSPYCAAKHALRGFVDALRVELRAQGSAVSLSLIEPGPVDTPFWDNVATEAGRMPPPIPFVASPDRVAAAVERVAATGAARRTVGAAWIVLRPLARAARPLADRLLARAMQVAERAGERGEGGAAIWTARGAGRLEAEASTRLDRSALPRFVRALRG